MYHHEKQSNYYCDETKKMALNSQTVRAKINPPPVEPQWAHPKTNTRQWPTNENFLSRSWLCLTPNQPWNSCFLLQNDALHCSAWQMKLKLPHWSADLSLFLWLPILTLSNWISRSLNNAQGIVLKFSHMMWIILNFLYNNKKLNAFNIMRRL